MVWFRIGQGHDLPDSHFAVVLALPQWQKLADRPRKARGAIAVEPDARFQAQIGGRAAAFFPDPAGAAIEFKAFSDMSRLFAK